MRQLVLKSGKYLFIFILILISNSSCDEIDSQIPEVYVSFTISLDIHNELTVPGNSIYVENVGYGGIIVYCELQGSYYAYDAACTNEINQSCTLNVEGALGTCSCCESKFIFSSSAYPTQGPAAAPLKQYNVSFLGGNMLRIYN